MPYGLTAQGFNPKTAEILKDEIEALWRDLFGQNVKVEPKSVWGNFISALSLLFAELWEVGQGTYSAFDRQKAEGQALDALGLLIGVPRLLARASTVTLTLTGTPATVVVSGRQVRTPDSLVTFATGADATIVAATAWAPATVYVVGNRRSNGGNIYLCTVGGTSAGAGGPTGTGAAIADNTVTWRYVGSGIGYVDAAATAVVNGPLTAVAYTVSEIVTPVSGWGGVLNLTDAIPGRNVETDTEYRLRQEDELSTADAATIRAIRDRMLAVEGVTSVTVFQNVTDLTDADGVPPHSVEILIEGGEDTDIFATVFEIVAAGIRAFGTSTSTIDFGSVVTLAYPVAFTRPTVTDIYATVNATYNAAVFPADGSDQIKAAIVAWGDALGIGHDVFASGVASRAFTISGLLNVTSCFVGTAPAPVGSSVTIGNRAKSDFDTSRIVVNLTPASP